MKIVFSYKCRRCNGFFDDPGTPVIEVGDVSGAQNVLNDSLSRNPTAKTRVALWEAHRCVGATVGVGDLVGYRILTAEESSQQSSGTNLKLIRQET